MDSKDVVALITKRLKLLTEKELVRFIQKIGHFQAARIIEEHNIKGSKILELTNKEIFKWNLTEIEQELLLKCINQLRLNHLTETDSHLFTKGNNTINEPQSYRSNNKYFKYKPNEKFHNDLKNCITKLNAEKMERLLSNSLQSSAPERQTEMTDESEYISFPNKNDAFVNRLKNYLVFPPKRNTKYELLTNASDDYIGLSDRNDNQRAGMSKRGHEHISAKTKPATSSKPKAKEKSVSKHCKLSIQLCCISCGISFERD